MNFRGWYENHYDRETGYWVGGGEVSASGVLLISQSTGRIGIHLRSAYVHNIVNGEEYTGECWGVIGGAAEGDPASSAKKEVQEETGYTGPYIKFEPAFLFRDRSFSYQNYIALVPEEFEGKETWEGHGLTWLTLQELSATSIQGHPKHDGLSSLLSNSHSKILEMSNPKSRRRNDTGRSA